MELGTKGIEDFAPQWMKLLLPTTVPDYWLPVVTDYVKAVVEILDGNQIKRATIRAVTIYDRLHFDCSYSGDVPEKAQDVLQTLAVAFADVSQFKSPDTLSMENSAEKTQVFSWNTSAMMANATRSSDTSERLKATYEKLKKSGQFRAMQQVPRDWRLKLEKLNQEFPNFSSVIRTIVHPHIEIIEKGGRHRMSPILLVGEPGIGKTYFAHGLAQMLGFKRALFINMAEESNASGLSGSSSFWSNTSPGKLFDFLAWGNGLQDPCANPVVILDEIDKASSDRYDPLSGMYTLLEADTSARFQDQSVPDVWLDASRVRFICTANDSSKIPRPLLSRMTVFRIEKPSEQQLRLVLRNIFRDLVDEIGLPFSLEIPEVIMDATLDMSPREAKIRLECSIAFAIADDRTQLLARDWPDLPNTESHGRKSIGFISN